MSTLNFNNPKSIIFSLLICVFLISCNKKQTSNEEAEDNVMSFLDFKYTDIGSSTQPGTASFKQDELTMVAGGSDIWGKHDEFLFGYTKVAGDFDISVQILSLSKAHQYTKAGIMARVDLNDSSQHVYFQVFPDNTARNKNDGGIEFQYRSEKAKEMRAIYPDLQTAGNQFDVSYPNTWVRLKRQGDDFKSYFSNDNTTWVLYSSYTLKIPVELLVGIAVTAHNSNEYTTARFSSLQLIR